MEKPQKRILRRYLIVLLLGIICTFVTITYQKKGPFMGVYGNLCGPDDTGELCIRPILQGGWPLPYLLDFPGVSVPGRLSFLEDDFYFGFFMIDFFFFACCINLIWNLIKRE
jgi:hypothetical protein